MASLFPVVLVGGTLGQRRRHLNSLVAEAHRRGVALQAVRDEPERSPLDRLFKIQLADRSRHLDYILHNLKDEDMLYVSTALKSKWLLECEYRHIVNPHYLEKTLYPQMTMTAANKMKHWIYLNLRDSPRCEEFYEYYEDKFDAAIKFLPNCSDDFILSKVGGVLDKLTPHYLKVLCEKCPEVAKIYFDSIQSNESVKSKYAGYRESVKYYNSVKCVLKHDANIFLDITEKYFDSRSFKRLSPMATMFIMVNHRDRFTNKPELYTARFLDLHILSKHLNTEEIKDVVLKLARADYLNNWFSYKSVEPLIAGLPVDERSVFKKQIFVDKLIGDKIKNWPYEIPSPPEIISDQVNIFQDINLNNIPSDSVDSSDVVYCELRSDCSLMCVKRCSRARIGNQYTMLNQLFDRYRYDSFEKVMSELRCKMLVESMQNRQYMMLVLVSKSGGRSENVEELLNLLTSRHENEPMHLRATVIRSLVRRCCVWRLPQTTWELLVNFGRDLGMDGKPTSADCNEGLHAVMIRNMMLNKCDSDAVWKAFLEKFSTLKEYSLSNDEKQIISVKLPALLMTEVESHPERANQLLKQLLDVVNAYKISIQGCSGVVSAVVAAVHRDPGAVSLLHHLFNHKICRRELFRENFKTIQTDASYINALRHGTDILESGMEFQNLVKSNALNHDRFLRTLVLYFNEEKGLAQMYYTLLERSPAGLSKPKNRYARSLAYFLGNNLISKITSLENSQEDKSNKGLAAGIRANAHLSRPHFDLETTSWQVIGAQAVANRVLNDSILNVDHHIGKLISQTRTERIAFVLSMRVGKEYDIFQTIAARHPKSALKMGMFHLRLGKCLDIRIWKVIMSLIANYDGLDKLNAKVRKSITKAAFVPSELKPQYLPVIYDAFRKISMRAAVPILVHLQEVLHRVEEEFIERIIKRIIQEEMTVENVLKKNYRTKCKLRLYVRIVGKYILLCKTEVTQKKRIQNIGQLFFAKIEEIWKSDIDKKCILFFFDEFVQSLKYMQVFLDTNYVSCVPVFESLIESMQRMMPIEVYFKKYVFVHLTMLYFKAIRQSIKNNCEIFDNLPNNQREATVIVGTVFGKYIACEASELTRRYFDSVRVLYTKYLSEYLGNYLRYGHLLNMFRTAIIRGILDSDYDQSHLIAGYLYQHLSDHDYEIFDIMWQKANQEMQFFLSANHLADLNF